MFYENVPAAKTWCQCCSLVYRIRRGAQTHLPSFCRLQKIQSEDRPPLHDLAQNVDSQTELRAGGLNESQVLVLADCGETKGSASSDKHTHSESTERSNASSLLIYIHTLNVEPQALAVNTQASHRMLCKYLQIGMHWREKDTADQAEHDWPQPTACTQHTPAHPQAWNELDKKRRSPKHDLIQHPHATAYLGDVKWDLLSVGTERRGKYLLKRVDYYAADIITVFMHKVT